MDLSEVDDIRTVAQICQTLFELSLDGFLLLDRDANILYINQAYCQQLGIQQSEAIGKPAQTIVTNTDLPNMMRKEIFTQERNILWQVKPGQQYTSNEKFAIVSRCVVTDKQKRIIGAVGQVKFVNETLRMSKAVQDLKDELNYLKTEITRIGSKHFSFDRIIGDSDAIMETKVMAKKAATNDFPVLLTGESGTGKEVFANAIHYASKRRSHPIVRVNCAAIPGELFESELFGYSEGAFTGAKKRGKRGKILLANRGTLFLDEVAEMPPVMQAKLLRVLQEQEIDVVGDEAPVPVDVRIIAATNKDLRAEIAAGRFRLDLYYRLNVVEIHIPPLRERSDDILSLAEFFLNEFNEQYFTSSTLAPDIVEFLNEYDWPGNVRELHNVLGRAYMVADGMEIQPSHFPLTLRNNSSISKRLKSRTMDELKADFEREVISEALRRCDGNVQKCADMLKVHRSTLYNKIKAYQC